MVIMRFVKSMTLLQIGDWLLVHKLGYVHELACYANAAIMTAWSMACIYVFDIIADWEQDRERKIQKRMEIKEKLGRHTEFVQVHSRDGYSSVRMYKDRQMREFLCTIENDSLVLMENNRHEDARGEMVLVMKKDKNGTDMQGWIPAKHVPIIEATPPVFALSKMIRHLIGGYSLLVGLAWDHAFDAALDTIVGGSERLSRHYVASKCGLSLVIMAGILPAWLWYIVPKAQMGPDMHHEDILHFSEKRGVEVRREEWESVSYDYGCDFEIDDEEDDSDADHK